MAHVALAHDAARRGILRHVVGAFQDAVAATDALVIEVADDAGDGVFVVGQHRTAFETAGLDAVVAGRGDGLLERDDAVAAGLAGHSGFAEERADFAPRFAFVEAVEGVAGGDASLAAGAFVQVHLEGVLLAGARGGDGQQLAIVRLRDFVPRVRAREGLDGRELPLLIEQRIHERVRASGTGGIRRIGMMEHRHTFISRAI